MKTRSWVVPFVGIFFISGAGFVGQGCGGSSQGSTGPDGGGDPGGAPGAGGIIFVPKNGGNAGGGISGDGGIPGTGGIGGPGASGGTTPQGGSTGTTCGGPGLPCCVGNECAAGGCCVSGICMAPGGQCVGLGDGICSAGACGACGGPGLPCCGANPSAGTCTAPRTKCSAGTCTACGTLGSVCCTDATGGNGTCEGTGVICSNGLCVACGQPGTGCCPGSTCAGGGCCYNNICISEGTACASGGACQAGRCSGCGSVSQPCCNGACYDGLLCNGSTCTSCGNVGETCCSSSDPAARCKAGHACVTSGTTSVCARCGGLGDICCANNACSEGCCSGGRCLANGSCTTPDASIQPDAPVVGSGGVTGSGGVVGSGGVGGTGGTTSTTPGPCGDLIDDMESGTGWICNGNSRVGHWFTYVDSYSSKSSITPLPNTIALPELLSTPRDTSQHAMHVAGKFTDYAGLGVLLNLPVFGQVPGVYDASGYTGIKFWVKGTPIYMEIRGQMPSTESVDNGGTCSLTTCMPNLYLTSSITTSWKQITIPFSYFTGGSTTPFKASTLWSIEFGPYNYYYDVDASFDFWIDDLTFYK